LVFKCDFSCRPNFSFVDGSSSGYCFLFMEEDCELELGCEGKKKELLVLCGHVVYVPRHWWFVCNGKYRCDRYSSVLTLLCNYLIPKIGYVVKGVCNECSDAVI